MRRRTEYRARVTSQIGTFGLPPRPDAPVLTVRREQSTARLAWTAPGQRVERYRIEYAIADGAWVEMDTSFDSNRHVVDVTLDRPDATYTFRVRAINESGSVYSEPVTSMFAKRRAVR